MSQSILNWSITRLLLLTFGVALVWAAPALSPLDGAAVAIAQDEEEDEDAPMKGKKTQALRKKVYDIITKANELVDAKDYAAARRELDKAKAMTDLTSYETAQLYSFYGFLNFDAENYVQAKSDYKKVLAQPDLPEGLVQQTYRTLAQLEFVTENYQGAINYAQQYIDNVKPDAEMYALIGTAYYQMDQVEKIISPVEKAIELTRQKGGQVKEQWWLLLRVAYWEKQNYRKVKDILEILVVNWPKKDYWAQLSGVYYELKDEPRQLAAYEAAYDQGLLTTGSELVQMAQLWMAAEVPYKAAKLLEEKINDGTIEKNERNYRLLSQAWQLAQEDRKAIPPLQAAAGMSGDGELYARLATSYLNLSEYRNCVDASNSAINKGGLKSTGDAWLILGMCQFELDRLSSAKTAFRNAAKFDKSAKNARSWIKFVESEEARLAQLRRSLERVESGGDAAGDDEAEAADAEAATEDA